MVSSEISHKVNITDLYMASVRAEHVSSGSQEFMWSCGEARPEGLNAPSVCLRSDLLSAASEALVPSPCAPAEYQVDAPGRAQRLKIKPAATVNHILIFARVSFTFKGFLKQWDPI